jgi:hypothetical protein
LSNNTAAALAAYRDYLLGQWAGPITGLVSSKGDKLTQAQAQAQALAQLTTRREVEVAAEQAPEERRDSRGSPSSRSPTTRRRGHD